MNYTTTEDDLNPALIRKTIFHITAVCGGLPAVVWALHVLYHHHRSGGRISAFSIFYLLSDLLELILSSVILAFMLGNLYVINCSVVFGLLFGARSCGHHLHRLVALESALSLRYPSLAHIFSPLCSTVLCIIVVLLVMVLMFLNFVGLLINMVLCLLPLVVLVFTCLLTCKTSSDHVLPTNTKPGVVARSIATFTLVVLYVPFLLNVVMDIPLDLDCLVSLRVIADPLLCALVCRESLWLQKAQERSDQSDAL